MEGESRNKALESLLVSQSAWYRGVEVDRLSKQEAEIIGGRLVRLIQEEVELSSRTAKVLGASFADVFKQRFIRDPINTERKTSARQSEALLKVARQHLDELGIAAFQKAVSKRYRPQPGEKHEAGNTGQLLP